MEIKSEPQYDTINVTDIDVAYPGDLQTFCVREDQATYVETEENIVITFVAGGRVRLNKQHAHWDAIRPRTLRVIKPETPPVTP